MEKLSRWYGSEVLDECKRLRKYYLETICSTYHGPMDQVSSTNTMYPFVLLLGNHSSGKSSFINYLLKRKVQMTGVAPTDDCFTIIGPGDEDIDRNGPALVGDPDLGFNDLKSFGPILINHTQLKVRNGTAVKDFMIVDSPGMIDSPVSRTSGNSNEEVMDRGYDFSNVCRWYAERADVILLFFDPDKPGTTGETLSILTNALVGLDHKLYIILNKADQFRKIHDFARAYGSLCWNLSKVIPRKDLPRIHTMCIPVPTDPNNTIPRLPSETTITDRNSSEPTPTVASPSPAAAAAAPRSFFDQGILDLEEGREEVIKEVYNAPKRRVDNEISRLFESVSALQMHCQLIDYIVQQYQKKIWYLRLQTVMVGMASLGITYGVYELLNYMHKEPAGSTATTVTPQPVTVTATPPPTAPPTPATVASTSTNTRSTPSLRGSGSNSQPSNKSTPTSATTVPQSDAPIDSTVSTPSTPTTVPSTWSWIWSSLQSHWKMSIITGTALMGLITTSTTAVWNHYKHERYLNTFNQRVTYEKILREELFAKELATKDAFIEEITEIVLEKIVMQVNAQVIPTLPRVSKQDQTALQRILEQDIAQLRRRASPSFPTNESKDLFPASNAHQPVQPGVAGATTTTATTATKPISLFFPPLPDDDGNGNAHIFTRPLVVREDDEDDEDDEDEADNNTRRVPSEALLRSALTAQENVNIGAPTAHVLTQDELDIINSH